MTDPQRVTRVRYHEVRGEGAKAAQDGKTPADCPYSVLDGAAERILAHAWIVGFSAARSYLLKQQQATQTP